VKLYPKFQEYFKEWEPRLLAIWGKYDPYFVPAGAEAFRRDHLNAKVQFLDTGHFALETHVEEIAEAIKEFLAGDRASSCANECEVPRGKGPVCNWKPKAAWDRSFVLNAMSWSEVTRSMICFLRRTKDVEFMLKSENLTLRTPDGRTIKTHLVDEKRC
jgi:hypothetical protein